MDKDIKPQNVRFYCRTCLNQFNDCKYEIEEMPTPIFQLFKQCTNYKKAFKSLYPNSICNQCYDIFKNYEELRMTSKKSAEFLDKLLTPYVQKSPKTPPEESDDSTRFDEFSFTTQDVCPSPLYNDEKLEDPLLCGGEKTNLDQQQGSINVSETLVKVEIKEMDQSLDMEDEPLLENLPATTDVKAIKTERKVKAKKDFTCDICNKTYATASSLSTHKRLHNPEKHSFKCDHCDRVFNKKFRLTNHLEKIHGVKRPKRAVPTKRKYKDISNSGSASDADDDTKTIATLKNELKNFEGTNIKTEAEATLFIQQTLSNLIDKDDFSNINKMCKICHKSFSSTAGLRLHLRTHQDTPRFSCEKCGRGFNKKSRFNHHMEEVHADKPIEIVCKYGCGKTFKRSESAAGHYRLKHILPAKGAPPKDYTRICEECGKICKNLSVLKEHHYQHVPLEECPYQCGQCKKRFRSKKHMQHHLLRHAGIKKFECSICGMKKITPHELRVHMNYHTKKIQHYCSVCNKAFTNPGNMRRHEQVVHQGIKKFNCRFCEESFGKAETLKHHEMRHTGERPHKCTYCERSFIQAVALKTHLKTHMKAHDKLAMLPPSGIHLNDAVGLLGINASSTMSLKVAVPPPPPPFVNDQNSSHSSIDASNSSTTNLNLSVPSHLLNANTSGTSNLRITQSPFGNEQSNRSLLDTNDTTDSIHNTQSSFANEQNNRNLLEANTTSTTDQSSLLLDTSGSDSTDVRSVLPLFHNEQNNRSMLEAGNSGTSDLKIGVFLRQ